MIRKVERLTGGAPGASYDLVRHAPRAPDRARWPTSRSPATTRRRSPSSSTACSCVPPRAARRPRRRARPRLGADSRAEGRVQPQPSRQRLGLDHRDQRAGHPRTRPPGADAPLDRAHRLPARPRRPPCSPACASWPTRTDPTAHVHRYRHLIVPIAGTTFDPARPPIDVTSIGALAQLAERSERLILHHQRDGVDTYLVDDEGTLYRYQAHSHLRQIPALSVVDGPVYEPVRADRPGAAPAARSVPGRARTS